METRIAPFCSFLFFVTTLCSRSTARDTLTLSTPLLDADGATLISDGGRFALGFFSPLGSSNRYIGIWYHNINHNQTVVWVANRKHAITDRSGRLSLTGDRGLTVTDGNSIAVWSSHSATVLKSPVAQLLDSGNFVVSNGSSVAWQSFEFPTDTYIPSMKIGWDLTTGRSYNLTAWTSESDPAPSGYTMSIDQSGDPQLVITDGPRRHWRGGPWNGNRFSGAEGMQRDRAVGIGFNYTTNPHQVFFSLYLIDTSIIDRLVISTSGTLQHYMWIQDRQIWTFLGFVPRDECDSVARCGPNGVCHPDGSTMCTCLPGFASRNNSVELDGCVRITALDCVNGTDGFVNQSSVKLPDTSTAMVDWSMVSLEECRVRCLRNCSCTGYAQANVSDSGSGCVLWWTNLLDIKYYNGGTGQDLFVRVAAADLPSTGAKPGHRSPMVAVIVAPALAIILLAFIVYWICWRKKKHDIYFDDDAQEEDLDLPIYDLYTIAEATNNFSESNKLGQGGYGPVYKGKLMDGQEIAVKRLSMTSTQGAHEFKNEVTVIAKLQHRNLVRLLGCCIEARERMLIYEFMPNGSLDALLFDKAKSGLLDWKTRYNIIVGIARGLLYLHHDSRLRIIHRDMKASNILLDEHMDPKISDFGMARTFRGDDIEANTMRIVGTYGYMSPEYAMNGMFSIKSDVFSFGILILEIISGRRNRGVYNSPFHMNLLSDVWNLWEDGEALKLVDESIAHSFVATEVLSCIKCGLLCVQEQPMDRPMMNTILKMLDTDVSLLPEPSPSRFINLRDPLESDSSTTIKSKTL
ncbi:receptor-like serine/threonine-protein kinase SD1-8 isoform X1 [Zingiber officinale]|uniref:receptor-like serine/threonine-protein kinase SD1-8 isoform X1 n=2 Tax=Zingiber officinale TaxID=94328 RepID=UPI001C4BD35E|nr:receptor-like serine/threonine-protein kinase SD1-8 isoform X1 [Zingiber officinale]